MAKPHRRFIKFTEVVDLNQFFWKSRDGRTGEVQRGGVTKKWEKEERSCDWQLSGPVPAEVVPPADCYYQQKDFPIALAGPVSPLSPGGCYPIWEEMNRGPLTPYEVSVDRIFTEGAQWSKQALCQHQHLRQKNTASKHRLGRPMVKPVRLLG